MGNSTGYVLKAEEGEWGGGGMLNKKELPKASV